MLEMSIAPRAFAPLLMSQGQQRLVSNPEKPPLPEALIADLPPMTGGECLTPEVLVALWDCIDKALRAELSAAKRPLQAYLNACNPAWNQVGRVYFNLAENRKDAEEPFVFLATYVSHLSAHGKAQHQTLLRALTEFSDGKSKAQLLSLLLPVQRPAKQCAWLREMSKRATPITHCAGCHSMPGAFSAVFLSSKPPVS